MQSAESQTKVAQASEEEDYSCTDVSSGSRHLVQAVRKLCCVCARRLCRDVINAVMFRRL